MRFRRRNRTWVLIGLTFITMVLFIICFYKGPPAFWLVGQGFGWWTEEHDVRTLLKLTEYKRGVRIAPNGFDTSYGVCLATQTSIDRAADIGQVAEYWQGPISLVIGLREHQEVRVTQHFVDYMSRCHAWFEKSVSVHVGIPEGFNVTIGDFRGTPNNNEILYKSCTLTPTELLKVLIKKYLPGGIKKDYVYPQNHYRNFAKRNCKTHWIFVTDVDIIPQHNAAPRLHEFLRSELAMNCSKCAFVVPVYEIRNVSHPPETKKELLSLVSKKLARQFHTARWKLAQSATNYKTWSSTNKEEGPIKISHNSTLKLNVSRNMRNYYEPFYISPKSIPDYMERFVGFGSVRNSQVFQAALAGWKFKVLTPIFVTHYGYAEKEVKDAKTKKTSRYKQATKNSRLYAAFVKEIWTKQYGNSTPATTFKPQAAIKTTTFL